MKQIFKSIFDLTVKFGNFLCPQTLNSNNKIENHFHGTVNFIGKQPKTKELEAQLKTHSHHLLSR